MLFFFVGYFWEGFGDISILIIFEDFLIVIFLIEVNVFCWLDIYCFFFSFWEFSGLFFFWGYYVFLGWFFGYKVIFFMWVIWFRRYCFLIFVLINWEGIFKVVVFFVRIFRVIGM